MTYVFFAITCQIVNTSISFINWSCSAFLSPNILNLDTNAVISRTISYCRSIIATFVEETYYDGIKVNRYTADLGDMSTDEELKCYCPTPTTCLKKGLMDISKCNGNPVIASLPHFYLTDESYLQKVKGLHPEEEKHSIQIFFESVRFVYFYHHLPWSFAISCFRYYEYCMHIVNSLFRCYLF